MIRADYGGETAAALELQLEEIRLWALDFATQQRPASSFQHRRQFYLEGAGK